MKSIDKDIRADYSSSLLHLSTGKVVIGTPLAFGEGDTKVRIENIMKYKKPTVLIIVLASILCILLTACLSSNPQFNTEQSTPPANGTDDQVSNTDNLEPNSTVDNSNQSTTPQSTPTSVPYTIQISRTDTSIYEGPGYDYTFVGTIHTAGAYTIVEEEVDYEGILWGKLGSGAGWIDIVATTSEEAAPAPIGVSFAEEDMLSSGNYHEFIADNSEYMVKLIFTSNKVLTDVRFSSLVYGSDGTYDVVENLHTLDEITPDMPFVAGVVFYGDMTTYGISFTDADGQAHHFAAYISGRNGSLLLEEYTP